MSDKKISVSDQQCISQCIFSHWGEQSSTPPEHREAQYQQCLSACRICS